jgi:hypothetical protein
MEVTLCVIGESGQTPRATFSAACVVPDQRILETKCMSRVKIRWCLGANSVH